MKRLVPILVLLVSLALACTQAQPTPTPPPPTATPAPTPTPVPTATPTRAPAASPTASAGGLGGAFSGSAEALNKLKSYRYVISVKGTGIEAAQPGAGAQPQSGSFTMEGAHVSPDREYIKFGASDSGAGAAIGSLEAISIGSRTWIKMGEQWIESPAMQGAQLKGLSPAESWSDMSKDFPSNSVKPAGKETVNGVPSQHYTMTLPNWGADLGLAGATGDASGDVWVAEDGQWPVRVVVKASIQQTGGTKGEVEFTMNITNINDASIKIDPPLP